MLTADLGLLERHGEKGSRIRTRVVADTRRPRLDPVVRSEVAPGSTLNTDALRSYNALNDEYFHNVIDHAECYAKGTVHTNGLENYWSLLKRAIKGTYVSVEPFHLFRYLDEQAFRFNERGAKDADRFRLALRRVVGRRVTYDSLVGREHDL